MGNEKPVLRHFRVNFAFTAKNSATLRTGSRIIQASDAANAANDARKMLGQEYDFFKITSTAVIDNDHPQKSI